jgi:hypothetical protein
MKTIYTILSFFLIISLYGQRGYNEVTPNEVEVPKDSQVKQFNLVKVGSSIQVDPFSYRYYGYDYYDSYYYYEDYYYDNGPVTQVYATYEHIWQFKNNLAVSVEPRLGASFWNSNVGLMAGNEIKFYWANTDYWRMGVAAYAGYTYTNRDSYRWVNMQDGAYQQRIPVTLNFHSIHFGPTFIPFQFRIKNSPIVIENMITLMGFSVVSEVTRANPDSGYEYKNNHYWDIYPYFLKFELKVGIVIP